MTKINHLEIYKRLNKSNCGECRMPTCMAFALSVINSEKNITDCPHLDKKTALELDGKIVRREPDKDYEALIRRLKNEVSRIDLQTAADGLGAEVINNRLRINCLGKDFLIDGSGSIESVCHINTWVTMPLLSYIKTGGTGALSGKWISFTDLKKGTSMENYFRKRCEDPLRQLADSHTQIFFDLLKIFRGRSAKGFSADESWIIHPLPKVPFLILYWRPEEQFESNLKLLFDSTANSFLDTESIYVLGRGLVEMFTRIISRHDEILPMLLSL